MFEELVQILMIYPEAENVKLDDMKAAMKEMMIGQRLRIQALPYKLC